jgi:hypothetical protein
MSIVGTTLRRWLPFPDYYDNGGDLEWASPPCNRGFPNIHLPDLPSRSPFPICLSDLQSERPYVKHLAPELIQVNGTETLHETYDGQDLSGVYWTADVWVRRNSRCWLLVEEELPLPKTTRSLTMVKG